ncbi:MAG: transketolase C-terminal domain-containing protein, partial [Armatimonadota bacterium]
DDTPVVFIQHRLLHPQTQQVPKGEWLVPLGEADVKRQGEDLTIVAWSYALTKALVAAEALSDQCSVEVLDPRSLVPLDLDTILASVRKTGRLLVVHEAPERAGGGAEIVRHVVEKGLDCFKAPPRVLGGANVPMPYSPPLEDACIPQTGDIVQAAKDLLGL